MIDIHRLVLSDPTGQIERECADKVFKQKDVALTYALAVRDQDMVPVDWKRANGAIIERWSVKGLESVKRTAWRMLKGAERMGAVLTPKDLRSPRATKGTK